MKDKIKNLKVIYRILFGMMSVGFFSVTVSILLASGTMQLTSKLYQTMTISLEEMIKEEITEQTQRLLQKSIESLVDKETYYIGNWMENTQNKLNYVCNYLKVFYYNRDNLHPELYKQFEDIEIEKDINITTFFPTYFAESEEKRQEDETIYYYLRSFFYYYDEDEEIKNVTITFTDGFTIVYNSSDVVENVKDYRQTKWYIDCLVEDKENNGRWMKMYTNNAGEKCITYTQKVFDSKNGKVIAVAKIDLEFYDFVNAMKAGRIYEDDQVIVIKNNGTFVVSPELLNGQEIDENEVQSFLTYIQEHKDENRIRMVHDDCYWVGDRILDSEEWYFAIRVGKKHISETGDIINDLISDQTDNTVSVTYKEFNNSFIFMLSVGAYVLSVSFLLAVFLSDNFTRPLSILSAKAKRIGMGDFEVNISQDSNDEIGQLAKVMNEMLLKINNYMDDLKTMTAEQERISTELEIAAKMQANMLPDNYLNNKYIEIVAYMLPAKEVGGDFYDFFYVDESHICLIIADVSGKGVPAAMFMSMGKMLLREHTKMESDLGKVFYDVNNLLCDINKDGNFITVFEAVIDLETGRMEYVNAGHEKPFIKHNNVFEEIEVKANFVLAVMENMEYQSEVLFLEPEDVVFVYTDGIPEANNKMEELFGMKRLKNSLNAHADNAGKELIGNVLSEMNAFVDGAAQFDDTTMLTLFYRQKLQVNENRKSLYLDANVQNVVKFTEWMDNILDEYHCEEGIKCGINIVLDEIISNVAKYAYEDTIGGIMIESEFESDDNRITISIIDQGIPFNPWEHEDPDIELSAEERQIGGLGVFWVKQFVDQYRYEYKDNSNYVIFEKKLSKGEKHGFNQ